MLKLLFAGLPGAGISSILQSLSACPVIPTNPAKGVMISEPMTKLGYVVQAMEIGGRTTLRRQFLRYYKEADGIVFVMDSANIVALKYAVEELHRYLAEEVLTGLPLLILATKSDLPDAISVEHIENIMNLSVLVGTSRSYCVQSVSAIDDDSDLLRAMMWLQRNMVKDTCSLVSEAA